jgi:hypothetical protein
MNLRSVRPFILFAVAIASSGVLLACGGVSLDTAGPGDDGSAAIDDGGACQPLPCPSNAPWSADSCSCVLIDDGGLPLVADAMTGCSGLQCRGGTILAMQGSACVCVTAGKDAGPVASHDASVGVDASSPDATSPGLDAEVSDAWYVPSEGGYVFDGSAYDGSYYCSSFPSPFNFCAAGYTLAPDCSCQLCPGTCPIGQTPGAGCEGCTACPASCPAGFHYGLSCSCEPDGVDAGPVVPPREAGADAGPGCLLEGYYTCAADSWCELGTCPGGTAQYGCYCDHDGKATCSLSCPAPPPCTIPGYPACPPGQECVYGSCADDPSGELLVCNCSTFGPNNQAYCFTSSCADGGSSYYQQDAGPPSDGGVTCNLEGYITCSAGSFCPVGSCPGGSQYGCFCNADGTATCDLTCPPAPPCEIPGEGTCPYGTSCVFGCGPGGNGTGLSCYCGWQGTANCNTLPCTQLADGG